MAAYRYPTRSPRGGLYLNWTSSFLHLCQSTSATDLPLPVGDLPPTRGDKPPTGRSGTAKQRRKYGALFQPHQPTGSDHAGSCARAARSVYSECVGSPNGPRHTDDLPLRPGDSLLTRQNGRADFDLTASWPSAPNRSIPNRTGLLARQTLTTTDYQQEKTK